MYADNERRLARKCAELSSQAVESAAKAQTAQVMSADDGKTIASLKEEVERSWAALEASHQKASCMLSLTQACTLPVLYVCRLSPKEGSGVP